MRGKCRKKASLGRIVIVEKSCNIFFSNEFCCTEGRLVRIQGQKIFRKGRKTLKRKRIQKKNQTTTTTKPKY